MANQLNQMNDDLSELKIIEINNKILVDIFKEKNKDFNEKINQILGINNEINNKNFEKRQKILDKCLLSEVRKKANEIIQRNEEDKKRNKEKKEELNNIISSYEKDKQKIEQIAFIIKMELNTIQEKYDKY